MHRREIDARRRSSFRIFASEVRAIAALSAQCGAVETGGDLFGLERRDKTLVVMLALGAGPGATHEAAHFRQDIVHFRAVTASTARHFGIELIGGWHWHRDLGIDHPSPGDLAQVRSVTRKNNIQRWAEIITTHEPIATPPDQEPEQVAAHHCASHGLRSARPPFGVRINAFLHVPSSTAQVQRCLLNMIPGLSPIRHALYHHNVLGDVDLNPNGCEFPWERIVLDHVPESGGSFEPSAYLPHRIMAELHSLPPTINDCVRITPRADLIVISVPLEAGHSALVAYDRQSPHLLRNVCLSRDNDAELADVTAAVLDEHSCASLADIHTRLVTLLKRPRLALPGACGGDSTGDNARQNVSGDNDDHSWRDARPPDDAGD